MSVTCSNKCVTNDREIGFLFLFCHGTNKDSIFVFLLTVILFGSCLWLLRVFVRGTMKSRNLIRRHQIRHRSPSFSSLF